MCCLFGIMDYGNALTQGQKNHILNVLATACEARGTDATGIAYNTNEGMQIYKRPLPAHCMRFRVPGGARYVMGHTRLSTQGDERRNPNNHPFPGRVHGSSFALAHNGILHNDRELRRTKNLPATKIETDSFIAVQLIERTGELTFDSLKQMAELVRGTFTFTLMDKTDTVYIVKGNNPLCLYHWPKLGLYLYASTEDILKRALQGIRLKLGTPEHIDIDSGEIVRIDRYGHITRSCFSTAHLYQSHSVSFWPYHHSFWNMKTEPDPYIEELKSVAGAFGCSPEDIDMLLREGFSPEEIEECFYCMEA